MKRLLLVSVVLGAFTAVATSAAAVSPQTINLLEVDSSFTGTGGFDANGNSPPKVGQGFVIVSDLYRWNGSKRGAHAGTLNVVCTLTNLDLARNIFDSLCTAVASLPGGKITVSGLIGTSNRFVIPIVGGTGAYTGARGYVRGHNIGGENSNHSTNTIVITG